MPANRTRLVRTSDPVDKTTLIAAPAFFNTSMSVFDLLQWTFGGALILCVVVSIEYGVESGIMGMDNVVANKLFDEWAMPTFLISSFVSFLLVIFGWATYVTSIQTLVTLLGETRVDMLLGTTNKRKFAFFLIALGIGLVILSSIHLLVKLGF